MKDKYSVESITITCDSEIGYHVFINYFNLNKIQDIKCFYAWTDIEDIEDLLIKIRNKIHSKTIFYSKEGDENGL